MGLSYISKALLEQTAKDKIHLFDGKGAVSVVVLKIGPALEVLRKRNAFIVY